MNRPTALRYRGGSTKRYRCSTCTRRFRAWPDLWSHAEAMRGEGSLLEECDLVVIGECEAPAAALHAGDEA